MQKNYIIFALMATSLKADSSSICDSKFCVCHHNNKSDQDFFGEIVNCSYDTDVLKRDLCLPDTVYSLNLSRNNLSSIRPSKILQSDVLVELLLNNNQIKTVSPDAFRLSKLKRLDLSSNELDFIHEDTFKYIKKLEYLNLANNRFTSFGKITFHYLGELKEIILDNNNLGPSLDEENLFDRSGYGLTHKIQSLSISGINLGKVHDNFFVDAFDLKKLIISNNSISEIFEIPFTLEYLDLSDNPIRQISGEEFADLVGLKDLKLNNLLIQDVPDYAFASLHALRRLELERNINLSNFSATAFGREVLEDADDFALETLSLKGSRLSTLDKQLVVPFGQLVKLDLQGNAWNCDCNLVWLKKLQINRDDYDHLRCLTPKQLFNSRIFELKEKYFVCRISDRHVGAIIAVVSFCALLTSTALWIFLFLPKYQSSCNFMNNMYGTSAGYSVLPVNANIRDF